MYLLPSVDTAGRVSHAKIGISFLDVPVFEVVTFSSLIAIIQATIGLIINKIHMYVIGPLLIENPQVFSVPWVV